MKKITLYFSAWPSFLIVLMLYNCLYTPSVSCKCLDDQMTLLLELKNNLTFGPQALDKLVGWNESTDCCQWNGIECDNSNGRVISLDLSEKDIISSIDNSSSLFHLQFLQRLSLAANYEMQGEIPPAIGKLSSLTYLNLSKTNFSGQVPLEISQLVKLNVLDISNNDTLYGNNLHMKRPNLATIIQNLTNMRELYLDYVNNSAMENKWCQALSSSLPHLEVLSMSWCDLRGKIHKSLANLKHLSEIMLDENYNLTGPVPEFLSGFANLTTLSLYGVALSGTVPVKVFQIPTLRTLDLSSNSNLQGTLPEFSENGSLEVLFLNSINFSSHLTSSISNLKRLRSLDLGGCQFRGDIPSSIGSLNRLEQLDLSNNQFHGRIPSSIERLNQLQWLDLSHNQFEGSIPKSIFQLKELEFLSLSSNRLNGTLQLAEFLLSFQNLTTLELSFNSLSIKTDGCSVNSSQSFPQLDWLSLASCNLHAIPEFLKNQTQLQVLDLSMNHITGKVPGWMGGIYELNLSSNHFVELEPPLLFSNTTMFLDLHSNNLQGTFPVFSSNYYILDCSSNNFTSIDSHMGNYTSEMYFLSFSRNNLIGSIPTAICNATKLELLNLEHNLLGGTIPDCLTTITRLIVVNLRGNRLGGEIPPKFRKGCSLQTIDLNGNFLEGWVPQSLAYCKELKVLDLGNNLLNGTFPCRLQSLSKLQVLFLRSNNFNGTIDCLGSHSTWPLLQIVDLASNHFSSDVAKVLHKWTSMIAGTKNVVQSKPSHLLSDFRSMMIGYENHLSVTFKGNTYELQYILTIFSGIDFSDNAFHGELPTELGDLNALVLLNLSHNSLSGNIPSSIGNLSQIESLDLSCNGFSGKIPPQLGNLYSLGYLNLSFNKLSGKIPTATQLQSFNASSYEGNQGLYGPPLTPIRPDSRTTTPTSPSGSQWSAKRQIEWMLRGAGVGFPVGITIFLGPLLYIKRYREWYCKHLHRLVMKILRKEDIPNGRRRRRSSRLQRQRR